MSRDERQPRATASDSVGPGANRSSENATLVASGAERDDLSFPPVDFDAGFFARPPRASHEIVEEWRPDSVREFGSPSAKRRRAQLKKYVSLAMGLASAVCLAALVKSTLTHGDGSSNPQKLASAAAAGMPSPPLDSVAEQAPRASEAPALPEVALLPQGAADPSARAAAAPRPSGLEPAAPTAAAGELAAVPPAVPAAELAVAPTAAPAAELAAALPAAPPAELAVGSTAAPLAPAAPPASQLAASPHGAPGAEVPALKAEKSSLVRPADPPAEASAGTETIAPDPREALRQKKASQAALERGRIAISIEAGESAVLLDPLDADAWLVLGAAYQQKGDLAQARRCYKACVQRGQRGNRSECLAMLR
jgi:hypothetical protein